MKNANKGQHAMHIVLVAPEIPQNTGNIARTCAATGAKLHLVKPLGFSLDNRYMKRAGLDYWHMMDYRVYEDFEHFLMEHQGARMHFTTTKAPRSYAGASFEADDYLVFGCESKGMPETLLQSMYDRCIRIPMRPGARSLNLSNSVAVVLYEALRQQQFPGLQETGTLIGCREETAPWMDYL
jgi:tRNA (cytidine/uridine-2'-O-)-methyltransferase